MTLLIISPEIPTALIAVSPIFVGTSNVPFACRMENENPLEPIIISGQSLELCSGNCSEIISQGGQLSSIVQEVIFHFILMQILEIHLSISFI